MENMNKEPESDDSGYVYSGGMQQGHMHGLLLPEVLRQMKHHGCAKRLFDLGCGNGSTAGFFMTEGFEVAGVDSSADGVRIAKEHLPGARIEQGSCYDDLHSRFGQFPTVTSLEVVEHVFYPRKFAACLADLLEEGGVGFISTPYHGYLKNLALAVTNKFDKHFTALWDHGHIKFWSKQTLTQLMEEAGLTVVEFTRLGRIPPFAKTVLLTVRK
jgi:2-polyprenyl-3-methyl-5-hydroxy-6-metoxy-1,4-benzoquinol methylase